MKKISLIVFIGLVIFFAQSVAAADNVPKDVISKPKPVIKILSITISNPKDFTLNEKRKVTAALDTAIIPYVLGKNEKL